jgi:hypothetical protein
MDILNEPQKKKSNYVIWIIMTAIIIILLLFQFVNFAPKAPRNEESNHSIMDSVNK